MRSVLLSLACIAVRAATASSVYLLPQAEFGTMEYREVNAAQALSSVAHWLGLDRLDAHQPELVEQGAGAVWDVNNVFGGEKSGKTLVIAFDGDNDVIPVGVRSAYSVPSSLDGILSALVTRARTIFGASSLHTSHSSSSSNSNSVRQLLDPLTSSDSPAAQAFVSELEALSSFLDHEDDDAAPAFGAYRFAHFDTLKNELSASSYDEAVRAFHAAVSSARARNVRTALIHTPLSASFHNSRASQQPPQQPLPPSLPPSQPIFSTGTCFTSQETCSNKTSECSGRGQCQSVRRGGKECFVCACGKTVKSGKTTQWVGEKCERIDYSGPFVLLASSTILIAILIAGSIAVLSSIGGHPLPSVLASVAVPGMKEGQ